VRDHAFERLNSLGLVALVKHLRVELDVCERFVFASLEGVALTFL